MVALPCGCDPPAARAPETSWAQSEGVALELPAIHVAPCYVTGAAKKNNAVRAAGIVIDPAAVNSCAAQMKTSGEAMAGGMSFMVALGADQHVSAIDVVETCGVPAAAMLCLAQTFQHAGTDAEVAPRAGLLRMSFDAAPHRARATSSSVGFTSTEDFSARVADGLDRVVPKLEECARAAFARGRYESTWAVFAFTLAPSGQVAGVNLAPFAGDQPLLACAAGVFQANPFPAPPKVATVVRMPIIFEPAP